MEKRPGIRRLHQRGRVKRSVTGSTKSVIGRHQLTGQILRLIGEIFNTGIKIEISGVWTEDIRSSVCAGIENEYESNYYK